MPRHRRGDRLLRGARLRADVSPIRPNPSAVVTCGELGVHLAGIDGFDPEQSYASVIIVVPDPDALYASFAAGCGRPTAACRWRASRAWSGRASAGGPSTASASSTLAGTGCGSPGSATPRRPDAESEAGLARGIDVAARLADSHGDDAGGLATLERMLAKHTDAPAIERARALLPADLAVRLDRRSLARASLDEIATLPLSDEERAGLAADIEHVEALLR